MKLMNTMISIRVVKIKTLNGNWFMNTVVVRLTELFHVIQ